MDVKLVDRKTQNNANSLKEFDWKDIAYQDIGRFWPSTFPSQ